ncbi:hypothetical protein KM043_006489 [Ampulex compressa]|nr:hypothetical protein KM043_006489 [Ampulex compressa]
MGPLDDEDPSWRPPFLEREKSSGRSISSLMRGRREDAAERTTRSFDRLDHPIPLVSESWRIAIMDCRSDTGGRILRANSRLPDYPRPRVRRRISSGGAGDPRGSRAAGLTLPVATCTLFDYRSRFEDRLIASSVETRKPSKEVVGSRVPAATAETTCRLPPGSLEIAPRTASSLCTVCRIYPIVPSEGIYA